MGNFDRKADRYLEEQDQRSMEIREECNTAKTDDWGLYKTVEEYINGEDVLIIYAKDIKPEERKGEVPKQGYVWVD